MALSRSRRSSGSHELFWPGYVDVLSTLLLVFTFLLSVFMVAQFYVSQESTGKDSVLRRLQRQIAELTNLLSLEKGQGKKTQDELSALQSMLATLKADNERLTGLAGLGGEKDARIAALTKELSDNALQALEDRNACLLANHGMIATGPNLAKAMWLAVELETIARQYVISLSIGGPVLLSDAEIARVKEGFRSYGPRGREGQGKTAH